MLQETEEIKEPDKKAPNKKVGNNVANKTNKAAATFFDVGKLPKPDICYVLWMDIMGISCHMSQSLNRSANFIGKFHSIISQQERKCKYSRVYPIMDGAYIVFRRKPFMAECEIPPRQDLELTDQDLVKAVKHFIQCVYARIAEDFLGEKDHMHQYIVRSALAYGPVIFGESLTADVVPEFYDQARASGLILGYPIILANTSEHSAPPMGVFLDDSVLAKSAMIETERDGHLFAGRWYKWMSDAEKYYKFSNQKGLGDKVQKYFEWCKEHKNMLGYDKEGVERHLELAKEFFNEDT